MTNPFEQHRSALFAERESIDEALNYAHEVLTAVVGSDRAAAMTAVMVVVNTAAKLWPQPVQADPARALLADMVRQMVQETVGDLDLDSKMDEWAQNSLAFDDACDNRVERWIENNLDLSEQFGDFIRNGVTISIDTI
jgi:hypothetical protein